MVFVIDASADPADLRLITGAVRAAMRALPRDARVGLVTAGAAVKVYDLAAASGMAAADVVSGAAPLTAEALRALLFGANVPIAPLHACAGAADAAAAAVRAEGAHGPSAGRARCVAAALEVALGLIDGSGAVPTARHPSGAGGVASNGHVPGEHCGGQVIVVSTGPITVGAGAPPADDSHPLYLAECESAAAHVRGLGEAAAALGITVDVLAAGGTPLDARHVLPLCERSGGAMLQVEDLRGEGLASALRSCAGRAMAVRSAVDIEVRVSRPLVVSRVMGAVSAAGKESIAGGGQGEAVRVSLRVADSSAGVGVLYRVEEDVAGDFVYFQCVATYDEPGASAGGGRGRVTRVVTRRLRVTSNVPMLLLGVNADVAALLAVKRALGEADAAGVHEVDAGAGLKARARAYASSGDEACNELADRLVAAASELGRQCGTPAFLPRELLPFALRCYHFARGTAAAGGAPHPDEVALCRSRLRALGMDGACYVMPRAWMAYLDTAGNCPMRDVLPTNLCLMSHAAVVLDAGSHVVVWVGAAVRADGSDGGAGAAMVAQCEHFAARITQGRFPPPLRMTVREHSSGARQALARVAPAQADPLQEQDSACPALTALLPAQRADLLQKLSAIPSDELSFIQWLSELMEEAS